MMLSISRTGWVGVGVALVLVAITLLVRLLLAPWIGGSSPYLLFIVPVLASVIFAGVGSGIVAALSSALLGACLSAQPGPFLYQAVPIALFLLTSAGVIGLAWNIARWRDIAERRTKEALGTAAQAVSTAQQLSLLVDGATSYAIYTLDPEGRVSIWNKGAERIKGWAEQEIVGQPSSIFYPREDAEAGKPAADLAEAARCGRLEQESWRVRKDGSEFLAHITITALRDENGTLVGFGKVIRDITDERAAEAATEARQMQLRSILETVPDAMIVIDDHGTIGSFSTTAERLFGYSALEIVGRNVSMLMPSPDHERHDEYLARYLATGERKIIGTARRVLGRRADGSVFPLELAIGEAIGGGRRVFTGFIRDLSEKEATETHVQTLQSELLHVSRVSAMGTMASTLAHELNQPITAVINYVEAGRQLLVDPTPDALDTVREAMTEAVSEAMRAGTIVRRLREFVSRGEVDRRVEPLGPLIHEAAVLGFVGAKERGIDTTIVLASRLPPVLVDKVQIQQVIINLTRNAIDALGTTGGRIMVTAAKDGPMVRVSVIDNGPGLAPHVAEQLFQAFISTKREGMGLGLSICRTIVEAHGGRIWAEASPGGGTTFHFTLASADVEEADGG